MSKEIKRMYLISSIIFFGLMFLLIIPGFMDLWNTLDPFIGGWPFSEVFLFVVLFLMSAVLFYMFFKEDRINKKEAEMRKRGEEIDY